MTRHQLLIHPDIPYTSHNSSMCFPAEVSEDTLMPLSITARRRSPRKARHRRTRASVSWFRNGLNSLKPSWNMDGRQRSMVISKEEAYETAAAQLIHLSEHGGTGQGVIGALAGAGLRLTGSDGRFKGKFRIPSRNGMVDRRGDPAPIGIDIVQTIEGSPLMKAKPSRWENGSNWC